MGRLWYFVGILLFALQTAVNGQQLQVLNDMDEGVFFWIKSESLPPRDWQRWFIPKNATRSLSLVSPDRFHVAVEDQQRRKYSGGLMPLREMIGQNPVGVLKLGGIMETKAYTERYWDRRLGWRLRERQIVVRGAVTYTLETATDTYDPVVVPQSE